MPESGSDLREGARAAFDALTVGQIFTFRRTFTSGDVTLFCGVTGDFNPHHLDDVFARTTRFGRVIIPGLLTGSMMTHLGGLLGVLATEMSFQFLAPVYVGDTVTCTLTIAEKDAAGRFLTAAATYVNQDGVDVLRASFRGFPTQVRLAR